MTLRPLIEAHAPADAAEAGHRDTILAFLAAVSREPGGDPFDRTRFDPGHLTASAFILDPDRRRVLLVHHAKLGRWLQPGGHAEPGEQDPAAVALREAREETGLEDLRLLLDRPLDLDVHAIPPRRDEPGHFHLDLRWAFLAASGSELRASAESTAIAWAAWDDARLRGDLARAVAKLRALA